MEIGGFLDNTEGSDNELAWNSDEDSPSEDGYKNQDAIGKKRKPNKVLDGKNKKKLRRERTVAPPTAEEMIHLRETETLFKSNLFRLEIEEMLKEVRPAKSLQGAADDWIRNFKKFFKKIDEDEEWIHVSETDWLNNIDVQMPLPDLSKLYDGAYRFLKPVDVKPVGSYYIDCTMGPKFNVDVAVVVPKAFYRKKDYLNQTYHYKRALYLCAIAGHLKKSNLITEDSPMKFTCVNGDTLKPVLVVNPSGKASSKIEMLIHVVPEEGTFLLSRFIPSSNNVRKTWWGCQNIIAELTATPLYNTSIIEDMRMESNERFRKECFTDNDNMKDAVRLLRVWLRQRNYDQGYGSFSTYIMSMVLLYLKDKQKINKHMSSYQIIRNVWLYLSQSNWCQEGASLCKAEAGSTPAVSAFHGYFDVVFIDPSGYLNLTAYMNKLTYLKVRRESATAIELLDSKEVNGFQALFMVKMPFILQYDHLFSFTNSEVIDKTSHTYMPYGSDMDYNGNLLPIFIKLVSGLLEKGLRDRVTEINFELADPLRWDVNTIRPPQTGSVTFGMTLHSEYGLNIIDKGPQANLPEAVEFREFWGDKSELRRFKDGAVCECTVWESETPTLTKRFIINKDIIAHLLKNHLNILPTDYVFVADQLDFIIEPRLYNVSAEEACLKIHKSLEEFSRQLIELDDLPLEVTTVHCISSSYRYADVFPPMPCFRTDKFRNSNHIWNFTPNGCVLRDEIKQAPPYVSPIDLVVQMTFTRKWPDDLAACRRLTAAFYIAIAKRLQHKYKLKFLLFPHCLIVEKDGFMFRLYLGYSKEISLLKLNVTDEGVKQYRDTPESLELEKKFINLPSITGALHGLSVAEPGFGGSARLVKRWISSHMLDSSHFPPVLAELIVASLFLKPQPFKRLLQPQQIFLRFLNMLASTNWHTENLIVNFNNILTKDEVSEIKRKFEKERSSYPPLVVVTPYDRSGTLWTRKVPTLTTLIRIAKLAAGTLNILTSQFLSSIPKDHFTSIFTPNLSLYDAVIKLKLNMVPRRLEKISFIPSKKVAQDSPLITLPITDFDPPRIYLQYLRDNYDEFALFFHDHFGGSDIGVLFRPNMFEPSEFKVNSVGGKMPNHSADPVCLKTNFKSIISDFKEGGRGLVESIILNSRLQSIVNS